MSKARTGGRVRRLLRFVVACALACASALVARSSAAAADLGIWVLTMGPGDPTFSKFGHDAIVVNEPGKVSLVYNFGTFAFDSETLFQDFLKGRLNYWLSVGTLPRTVKAYQRQNRSLLIQELRLSDDAALELKRTLEENALPENRYYLYDHFRDNCSTRVRDAVDRIANGALKKAMSGPASQSYRDHALRLVADDWPLYLGLDFGLGPMVDQPITRWDEGFLPEVLAEQLTEVKVPTAGGEAPLVQRQEVVFEANRPPLLERAPTRAPLLFAVSAAFAAGLFLLGRKRAKGARVTAGSLVSLFGFVGGVLGLLLAFLWVATNNEVAHRNANAFITPLVALALVPAGVAMAMGKPWGLPLAKKAALACLALAALGVLLSLFTGQDIARTAALFVPLWGGVLLHAREAEPKAAGGVPPTRAAAET